MDVPRILQEASILFYGEFFRYDSSLHDCCLINKMNFILGIPRIYRRIKRKIYIKGD